MILAAAQIDPAVIPTEAWPLVAAAGLGMAAICLLLPRPQPWPFAQLVGAVLAGLALAGAAVIAARATRVSGETILFYAFAGIAIFSGGTMITRANPARAALSFALVVLSTTGLFLLQAAPFLMAGTVIVYAGAIVVTFLFVIMLAQPTGASDADRRSREPLLASAAGFFLLATLLLVLQGTYSTGEVDGLLARVTAAGGQDSLAEIRTSLGDREEFLGQMQRQVDRLAPSTQAARNLQVETDSAGAMWSAPSAELARRQLEGVAAALQAARPRMSRLQPPEKTPPEKTSLSPFAGTPADQSPTGISAENVAGLGRTLFSDYLLAVEIAGTLLLVATVGAIAIAHRPTATRRAA